MNFEERLDKAYENLTKPQVEVLQLPNPDVEISSTNTYWKNPKDFLKKINRPPQHFISFCTKHLNTEVTQKTAKLSEGFVIIGKHKKTTFIPLLKRYISEYVTCKACGSYKTKFKKDDTIRKYQLTCKDCGSSYYL